MKTYIIDIDGVISRKLKWSIGDSYLRLRKMLLAVKPNKNAIEKINKLYFERNTIILHTSRLWHDYEATVEWLHKHDVYYDQLIMAKPLGDVYVDDKNMSVEDFLK